MWWLYWCWSVGLVLVIFLGWLVCGLVIVLVWLGCWFIVCNWVFIVVCLMVVFWLVIGLVWWLLCLVWLGLLNVCCVVGYWLIGWVWYWLVYLVCLVIFLGYGWGWYWYVIDRFKVWIVWCLDGWLGWFMVLGCLCWVVVLCILLVI